MTVLFIIYALVTAIIATVGAIDWAIPYDDQDRVRGARRFFLSPMWPLHALRGLAAMARDATRSTDG